MAGPKLLYIAGLSHSGTTLLDLACSSGGQAISLGEVMRVVKEDPARSLDRACSCGKTGADCPFWGPLIRAFDGLSPEERYGRVMGQAAEWIGPDGFAIDSSKTLAGLQLAKPYAAAVLHISKDARAYAVSRLNAAQRNQRHTKGALHEMLGWWRQNTRIQRAVAEAQLPYVGVSYEALCRDVEAVAGAINGAVGAALVDAENPLGSTNHHVLGGNRMRLQADKELRYDDRWKARREWVWPYRVLLPVRRANEARDKG